LFQYYFVCLLLVKHLMSSCCNSFFRNAGGCVVVDGQNWMCSICWRRIQSIANCFNETRYYERRVVRGFFMLIWFS